MKKNIQRYLTVSPTDPDNARRSKILKILLAGTGTVSVIGIALSIFLFFTGRQDPAEISLILWGSLAALIGTLVFNAINRRSAGTASFLFLVFLNTIFAFSDTPAQLANGRSLFIFVIPVVMASILISPIASFFFAGIGSAIISMLAVLSGFSPNYPAIIGFFLIAFVSWLSARSLEQALGELRAININLDQVVADRTKELAESLSRERIIAGRNQAILNSIADGVIVFDKAWNATLSNPAIRGMLDIPVELVVTKNFRELIEHPRLSPKSRPLLTAMIEHNTQPMGFRIEWSEKTLSVSAAQVYDSHGEELGTVIVFRDFTREAELERLKNTFVGIVSHELRTPLNAILGYAEMFKESVYGPVNEKQTNMADRIMKNTQRLLALINDLLDQAQMEAGKLTIRMAPFKPAELLESLHSLLDKTASDKKLKLTSELDSSLPEILLGDASRLQQILLNLATNAIKFTEDGTVHIRVFKHYEQDWVMEVSDTGQGILEAEIPFVFETFRQVDESTSRSHGGFGLGLAIVKQLVHLMNGQITVKSTLGLGSTFKVTLPLLVPSDHPATGRST